MSETNVAVVRSLFETWNARDVDGFRQLHDPNVVVRAPEGWPEPGPFVGRDAVLRQFEELRETWDADVTEPTSDFAEAGDRVAVRFIWRGVGHGPESNIEVTSVFTVRNGRIFYQEYFWDHSEALRTMGLEGQAASQENVELVLAATDAFNAGDLDRWSEFYAPDVEAFGEVSVWPESSALHGRAEFLGFMTDVLNAWTQFRLETVEVFAVDDDRVVWRGDMHGTGAASGLNTSTSITTVSTIRDGQIARVEYYFDHNQALKAVGLEE
jgi:ketosteroid isomerase-like protein